MIVKMNITNHLTALFSLFITTILMTICLFWFDFDPNVRFILSIFFCIDALPALYLHAEYYLCNHGKSYKIANGEFWEFLSGQEIHYKKEEIDRITVYMPPSVYQGSNIHFLAIESYHFAQIQMKSGKTIIITSLLIPKVEDAIKRLNISYERKKRVFNALNL